MQDNNSHQSPQNHDDQESTEYPETQSRDAASMDDSQQGTRQHRNADAATEGRFEVGGDPDQMGTHGHRQDESLRNGPSGRGGGSRNGISESSKGRNEAI